jgi:hypothetical protein
MPKENSRPNVENSPNLVTLQLIFVMAEWFYDGFMIRQVLLINN